MSNIFWFQLLNLKIFLFFFVISDSKLKIFEFLMISSSKEAMWRSHFGLLKNVMRIFLTIS